MNEVDALSVRDASVIPAPLRLSVVIPVFNEAATIGAVIERVRSVGVPCELVIVDDGSHDGTRELLEAIPRESELVIVLHERNLGKGGALKTGFLRATGDIVLVQDADLEYDPADYPRLLQPIVDGNADVVFGSRFLDSQAQTKSWHVLANRFVTRISNHYTGLQLTDMETCYKVFRREVLAQIAPTLEEQGFGIEPELTGKAARIPGVRIVEVPISYRARSYAEGKKITWRDGLWAIRCAMKY